MALAIGGCQKAENHEAVPDTMDLVFTLGGATKAGAEDETVDHWTLLLFDSSSGEKVFHRENTAAGSAQCQVKGGRSYIAYALVNFPSEGEGWTDPSLISKLGQMEALGFTLSGNRHDMLCMSGKCIPQEGLNIIRVSRLVSKIEIREIKLMKDAAAVLPEDLTLERIYVTNALTHGLIARDYEPQEVPGDIQYWYNALSFHGSGLNNNLDAVLVSDYIGEVLRDGESYNYDGAFYTVPNTTQESSDSKASEWCRRCTRLVLQTDSGGEKYYYCVTLPAMKRNNCYTITKATIKNVGALDSETEVPGAIDIAFSNEILTWDNEFSCSEIS